MARHHNTFRHTLFVFIKQFLIAAVVLGMIGGLFFGYRQVMQLRSSKTQLTTQKKTLEERLADLEKQYEKLKSRDEYQINIELRKHIDNIIKTYQSSIKAYEAITDLTDRGAKTDELEKLFALTLFQLSETNYASAEATLKTINQKTQAAQAALAASIAGPAGGASAPVSNTAPGSGYSRQNVRTDFGTFLVDIVAADLNSSKVIVDTASDGDCGSNCPVLSLGDYVSRSGAFAGVNGSYFCPASYPSCAGKENTFDTLLMNKNKVYFNSANNVYSSVPAVIFSGSSVRYVGQSSEWGRDTGVDAVIANQPLLVVNNQVVFGGDDEVKRGGAGSRSFVGSTGSTAYIGVVHNVNAAQMARVLQAMGVQNALNLDSGGSTALWSGGYRVGPGRAIPNAVLFVGR